MKKLILTLLLILFSCTEKVSLTEQKIFYSNLIEPQKTYILSYYLIIQQQMKSNQIFML